MISAPLALAVLLAIFWLGAEIALEDEAELSQPAHDSYRLDRWRAERKDQP